MMGRVTGRPVSGALNPLKTFSLTWKNVLDIVENY